jgi:hypothetical protein
MSKELIAILLPLILQYTPTAIKDITQLIEGNPQKAGEADADYITRLGAQIDANDASIAAQDAEIQK